MKNIELITKLLIKKILCLFISIIPKQKNKATIISNYNSFAYSELQQEIKDINFDSLNVNQKWMNNLILLRKNLVEKDISHFLQWDTIQYTMCEINPFIVYNEFKYLKRSKQYDQLWKKCLIESNIGSPLIFPFTSFSSGNLIHQCYHLAQLQEFSNTDFSDYELIIEFGGGYGSMCRLLHSAGFSGTYLIFDLPLLCILQKYYLKANNLAVNSYNNLNCIITTSDLSILKSCIIKFFNLKAKILFIATWSLSESPISLRKEIDALFSNFSTILLAFQSNFNDINNHNYFDEIKKNKEFEWLNKEITHIKNNFYLFGINKML